MFKMTRTIVKAVFYLVFISFLLVLVVAFTQSLITYNTIPDTPMPLILIVAKKIMSIPVLGNLISVALTVLT